MNTLESIVRLILLVVLIILVPVVAWIFGELILPFPSV